MKMEMGGFILFLGLFQVVLFGIVEGDPTSVPVLFWSPEKSMSNLPDVSTNGALPANSFSGNFLSPLIGKSAESAVVFLQDKLHIDDFTKYADVYSVDSTGGSFKNVKNLMEENFSLELDQVSGVMSALSQLQEEFTGAVHKVSSLEDLEKIELNGKFLLLVDLAPISNTIEEEKTIASNDKMIGDVCDHLKQKKIKYTALYTGKRAERSTDEEGEVHSGRHLMAAGDSAVANGTFMNVTGGPDSNMFLFMKSMQVVVRNSTGIANKFDLVPTPTSADNSVKSNKTAVVVVEFPSASDNVTGDNFDVKLTFNVVKQGDRWAMRTLKLHVKPLTQTADNQTSIENGTMVNTEYDFVVPILYSFHCTWMNLSLDIIGEQNKEFAGYKGTYVFIRGFQFQPFMVQKNAFFDSVDCVPFFTLGIWMGLLPVFILILILIGGVQMLLSLSIMDKYDDPKGKTISIAAASD